jgi:mRNA interferase YafQ
MRIVKHTSRFRRDYKREKSGRHSKRLDADLLDAVALLAKDEPLPRRYFDHPLGGEWNDHRDCHIKPDLILIYRKPERRSRSVRLCDKNRPFVTSGRIRSLPEMSIARRNREVHATHRKVALSSGCRRRASAEDNPTRDRAA